MPMLFKWFTIVDGQECRGVIDTTGMLAYAYNEQWEQVPLSLLMLPLHCLREFFVSSALVLWFLPLEVFFSAIMVAEVRLVLATAPVTVATPAVVAVVVLTRGVAFPEKKTTQSF